MVAIQSLSPERIFRKEFIEQTIIEKLEPTLYFLDKFPVVDLEGATTFSYYRDDKNSEDMVQNGDMSSPVIMSELGQLSAVNFSPIEKRVGDTYRFGYKLEFGREVEREAQLIDEITRGYTKAAQYLSFKINKDIVNNLLNNAAVDPITLTDGAWNDSTAIADDIINMRENFEEDGWDSELTDLYLNKKQYYQLLRYYRATENWDWKDNQVEGIRVHNVKSNITQGIGLGLDVDTKPLTIYKNVQKDFSTDPKNNLVNVNTFTRQEYPHNQVIEFWVELGMSVRYPHSILKQTGL